MTGVDQAGDEYVARFYDEYGAEESTRFDEALTRRIEYAIHRSFLLKFVQPGDEVLDAGSGPGTFAIPMMEKGAAVTLADISPGQLGLAKKQVVASPFEAKNFVEASITDLSVFGDASFDVVVCVGGALSYVRDGYDAALQELMRVLRPGGRLVVGAMSLFGLLKVFPAGDSANALATFDEHIDRDKILNNDGHIVTEPDSAVIHMPLFMCTNAYLSDYLANHGCIVIGRASSNPLTAEGMALTKVASDPGAEQNLIDLEVSLSERPELLDSGEWVLVAARKN